MIRKLALTVALSTLALPAAAQSTFERFEAAAVSMNRMTNDALLAEIPSLEGNLPAPEWDDGLRAAYTCMYDSYVADVGEDAMLAMVIAMESAVETVTNDQVLQGGFAGETPEGLGEERAVEIVRQCRVVEAFTDRMVASGATNILTQEPQWRP